MTNNIRSVQKSISKPFRFLFFGRFALDRHKNNLIFAQILFFFFCFFACLFFYFQQRLLYLFYIDISFYLHWSKSCLALKGFLFALSIAIAFSLELRDFGAFFSRYFCFTSVFIRFAWQERKHWPEVLMGSTNLFFPFQPLYSFYFDSVRNPAQKCSIVETRSVCVRPKWLFYGNFAFSTRFFGLATLPEADRIHFRIWFACHLVFRSLFWFQIYLHRQTFVYGLRVLRSCMKEGLQTWNHDRNVLNQIVWFLVALSSFLAMISVEKHKTCSFQIANRSHQSLSLNLLSCLSAGNWRFFLI